MLPFVSAASYDFSFKSSTIDLMYSNPIAVILNIKKTTTTEYNNYFIITNTYRAITLAKLGF